MKYTIKYAVVDQSCSGLLHMTDDNNLAHAITTGIIDSEVVPMYTWDQHKWRDDNISEDILKDVFDNYKDWQLLGKHQFTNFEDEKSKQYLAFKYKKTLVQTRLSCYEFLLENARYAAERFNIGYDGNYNHTSEIIKDSQLVKLYAKAIEATTAVAMQELQMTEKSNNDVRARIYIAYHYYMNKLSYVTTKQEADQLMDEIGSGFAYGHGFE